MTGGGSVYRLPVQHNGILGPYKGGIRYHQDVNLAEVKALSAWMTFNVRWWGYLMEEVKAGLLWIPPDFPKGIGKIDPALTAGILPLIGPEIDVPAPDVNTNPQVMG